MKDLGPSGFFKAAISFPVFLPVPILSRLILRIRWRQSDFFPLKFDKVFANFGGF